MINALRFDRIALPSSPRMNADGSARFPCVPARAGILVYPDGAGGFRRELYEPHTDHRGVASMDGVPVTIGHPAMFGGPQPNDALRGTTAYVGFVRAPHVRGDDLRAELDVRDAKAVSEIASFALRELSCGYVATIDETPGVWRGQQYDSRQVERAVDHVALLPSGMGRCGALCSIRSDSCNASPLCSCDSCVSDFEMRHAWACAHRAQRGDVRSAQPTLHVELGAQLETASPHAWELAYLMRRT